MKAASRERTRYESRDLEEKAIEADSMNRLGKASGDLTEDGFNVMRSGLFEVCQRRRIGASRIALASDLQGQYSSVKA